MLFPGHTLYTLLPPRMYHAMVSCVAKIASAQEIPLWYADWFTCGSPASSKNSCSWSTMRNSRTLASVDVKVTLQKLSTFKGSFPPPLYNGTRIPVFKTHGTASVSTIKFNKPCNHTRKDSPHTSNVLPEAHPVLLLFLL